MEIFMKLKGFTLAEILVSMGVLGVIAALTLPGINVSTHKRSLETSFSKIVTDLESVNEIIITDKNTKSLRAACGIPVGTTNNWDKSIKYLRTLAEYYDIIPKVNPAVNYKYGFPVLTVTANSSSYFTSKNREYGFSVVGGFGDYNKQQMDYCMIYIDINGPDKGPNIVGNDLHMFAVDLISGDVYGFGSQKSPLFKKGGFRASDASYSKCPPEPAVINSTSNYRSCAGSIMDNDGKIVYKMPY